MRLYFLSLRNNFSILLVTFSQVTSRISLRNSISEITRVRVAKRISARNFDESAKEKNIHLRFNDRAPLRVPRKMHHPRMVCTGTRRTGNIFQTHSIGAVITLSRYPPHAHVCTSDEWDTSGFCSRARVARVHPTRVLINSARNDIFANLNLLYARWRTVRFPPPEIPAIFGAIFPGYREDANAPRGPPASFCHGGTPRLRCRRCSNEWPD